MNYYKKLHLPDYLSFTALFFSWTSIILLFYDYVFIALIINMIAFIFDIIDGYCARILKCDSLRGRKIDTFVDIFTFVIFPALLFYKQLSINIFLGLLGSYLIILFGILRLTRYLDEGILEDKKRTKYYRGVTTVHISLLIILIFIVNNYLFSINRWLIFILILIFSPTMISNYKSYKLKNSFWYIFIPITIIGVIYSLEYVNK